jgi:DNA-binding NtrC family response regulator
VNETQISEIRTDTNVSVLLVSETQDFIRLVLETLARKGILGTVITDSDAAVDFLDKNDCRLVLIEDTVRRHAGDPSQKNDSLELLEKIKMSRPELPTVMVASDAGDDCRNKNQLIETAVKAMRAGCRDFLAWPVSRKTIIEIIDTYVPNRPLNTVASAGEGPGCVPVKIGIVGKSASLLQTVALARKAAPTSVPVLITGESGTGKELISYVVHYNSRRAQGPFIKVNCAALSETLLESELFGHEKGAFTGAFTQHKGRFEAAHGGTLLLDEISETPMRFQAKLLRVLEGQDFQRVGSNDNINVDVRVISTTNKDLSQEVIQGRFRQDLHYRLCGIRLMVSPLRQRKEDLPDLVWHFVNLYAGQSQRRITCLDPAMMEIFSKYHWPGNVRQLRNVILTSLVMGVGETLSLADVSWLFDELQPLPEIVNANLQAPNFMLGVNPQDKPGGLSGVSLARLERQAILDTLRQTNGNQTRAAKVLGISDRTLRDKIRRFREQGCMTAINNVEPQPV